MIKLAHKRDEELNMGKNKNFPLATWVAPKDIFKFGSIEEDLFIEIFAEVYGTAVTKSY